METKLFDYELPEGFIAQHSVEPRDHSRLMVLDRVTGQWQHKRFFEIADELRAEDVLVFNNTKVFRARLRGEGFEIFLLRARDGNLWETLVRPGRKVDIGKTVVVFSRCGSERAKSPNIQFGLFRANERNMGSPILRKYVNTLFGRVVEKYPDGIVVIEFDRSSEGVIAFANEHGEIPIPPYVKEQPKTLEEYQTVYARETGSVAAPTAGFHFTERLLEELKRNGVQFEYITLHVGIGTFRPMKSQTLEEHEMHSEFVSLDVATADRINKAKKEGRRVIAVGTTTARTLEGVRPFRPFTGDINLFIKPGFDFKVIDGLITNFHLPKSTLLVLVSAFAGREHVLSAYNEAIKRNYRFFSFGDAMLIQ